MNTNTSDFNKSSNESQSSQIPPSEGFREAVPLKGFGEALSLIECPRDAMQGWPHFIPTPKKIQYLNALLK